MPRPLTRPDRAAGRPERASARPVPVVLAILLVVAVAVNLRPLASGVGPLMDPLIASFGQGEWAIGLLSALPCLCFGLIGLAAVPIARQLGFTGTLVIAFLAMTLGLLLRPLVGQFWVFVLFSVLALLGPSLANVVIPAWIKRHGGGSTVALMTLYSAMLSLGAASGPLLAVPLSGAGAEGWRDSIQAWGILAAVPMVFAIVVLTRTGNDFPGRLPSTAEAAEGTDQGPDTVSRSGGRRSTSLWRSPTAIALTCMFGLQSMNAYTQFGFLPSILTDAGLPAGTTGIYTAQIAGWGVIGGLLMPTVIARSTRLSWWCACFGALTALGWLGLLLAPTSAPTFWSALLGIGGFAFPTAIALIPARSRLPMVTARLSGMVQPVGYLLAGCGPLLLGVLLDATGSMVSVLSLMILRRILLGIAGWRAGSPRMVDDDLA